MAQRHDFFDRRRRSASRPPPRSPRTGRSATLMSAIRTPPSMVTDATAATIAKSPWRRAISCTDTPVPGGDVRERDAGQDLVGLERGREVAGEEVGGGDRPRAASAAGLERGVERERDRRELRRGIGVGQAAADRASCSGSRRGRCMAPQLRAAALAARSRPSARSCGDESSPRSWSLRRLRWTRARRRRSGR